MFLRREVKENEGVTINKGNIRERSFQGFSARETLAREIR